LALALNHLDGKRADETFARIVRQWASDRLTGDPRRQALVGDHTRIIERDGENWRMLRGRALVVLLSGVNLDRALTDCDRAIELNPADWGAWYLRAARRTQGNDNERAITDVSEAIRLDPRQAAPYAWRASCYQAKQQLDQAIADSSEAIRLEPTFARFYSQRATLFGLKKELDKVIADCTEAIRLGDTDADLLVLRASAYQKTKQHDQAIDDCTEARRRGLSTGLLFRVRASAYEARNQLDLAITDYTEAIRLGDSEAQKLRAFVYLTKKEYDTAIAEYTVLINRGQKAFEIYNNRGFCHLAKKEYDKAIADCTQALKLQSGVAGVYKNRGTAYMEKAATLQDITTLRKTAAAVLQPDWGKALADFQEAMRLDPQDADLAQAFCLTLRMHAYFHMNRREWDAAFARFREVIQHDPADGEAYVYCGFIMHKVRGDSDLALVELNRGIDLGLKAKAQPKQTSLLEFLAPDKTHWLDIAYLTRGEVHVVLDEPAKAISDFEMALRINQGAIPDPENVQADIQALKAGRGLSGTRLVQAMQPLRKGDRAAYQKIRASLLARFESSTDLSTAEDVAFACCVLPGADPAKVVALAQRAVDQGPQEYRCRRALAIALLRAGKHPDAMQQMGKALELQKESPTIMVLLALAHHHLGQPAVARKHLDQATAWIDGQKRKPATANDNVWIRLPWQERLALETLRQEAEALIRNTRQ
jgi:tetratricopeptide (TPR) repeat protein